MKRILLVMFIAVSLPAACKIVPAGRYGHGSGRIMIAPLLPPVVALETEPYCFYNDYQYYYDNNRWYYSKSKREPRDRYPKETIYREKAESMAGIAMTGTMVSGVWITLTGVMKTNAEDIDMPLLTTTGGLSCKRSSTAALYELLEQEIIPEFLHVTGGYVYGTAVSATRPATDYTARIIPRSGFVSIPLENTRILWQR